MLDYPQDSSKNLRLTFCKHLDLRAPADRRSTASHIFLSIEVTLHRLPLPFFARNRFDPAAMMSGRELTADLIPALHQLRQCLLHEQNGAQAALFVQDLTGAKVASLGVTADSADADAEVATLMHRLTHLEYYLSSYDNLCLIKILKDAIAKHIDIGSQADADVSVAKLGHKKGLEPVRLTLLSMVNAAIEQVTDCDELLAIAFPDSSCASKKKRGVNYFSSFNFDDLPAFEPLEITLRLLRTQACSMAAMQKLMALEVGELIEHPQWHELLALLSAALLAAPSVDVLEFVIHLHVRFVEGLEGQQSIDCAVNLLKYYWKTWGPAARHEAEPVPLPQRALSTLAVTHVRSFLYILKRCERCISQCSGHSAEVVVATIFLLLARGRVEATPLLEAISAVDTSGSAGLAFVKSMQPAMVATYAVHSSLLPMLADSLRSQLRGEKSGNVTGTGLSALRHFSLCAALLLDLTAPFFAQSAETLNFLTRTIAQEMQWEGKIVNGVNDIALEPVLELNKLFSQLSGMPPVWPAIQTASSGENASAGGVESDFSALLSSIGQRLRELVAACAVQELAVCQSRVLLVVENLLSFLPHDKSGTQETVIMTCCAEVVTRLVQLADTEAAAYVPLHKYLFCLGNLTLSAKRTRAKAGSVVQAWLSCTALVLSFFSKCGASEGAKRGRRDSADRDRVIQLQHELISGWHIFLIFVRDVLRSPFACVDIMHETRFSGSQFADALGEMMGFAVGCTKFMLNGVEGAADTADLEASNARLRSQCVGIATAFLISATSYQPFLVSTLSLKPSLARDVVDIFLSCIIGNFKLNEGMTGAEFQTTGVCESLVLLCGTLGEEVLLESPVWVSLVEFVTAQTTDAHVWDFNEVWYEGESSLSTVLEFLCGLSFAGHEELAFATLRRAWEPLDELCASVSAHSLAQLLSVGEKALVQLSCDSFYVVFLRVAHVAILNTSFCCRIRAYREDMGDFTRDEDTSNTGCDLHTLFCKALESRVKHLVCTKKCWRPFFLPFTEEDLASAMRWAAAEEPADMRSLLALPPALSSVAGSLALDIFAGNIGSMEISQKLSAHLESVARDAEPGEAPAVTSAVGAAALDFLSGGRHTASTIPAHISDDSTTVSWLAACSHVIGVSSRQQYSALLHAERADTDAELLHRVVQIAMTLLGKYKEGRVHNVFARLNVSSETIVRSIVGLWFTATLCPDDLALVTAATWISGARQAAMVATAITVAIGDILRTSKQGWGSCGGAEAVTRAMCDPSFADFRIGDNRILDDLRVIVAEL